MTELEQLYLTTSKHSNYQILPNRLRSFIELEEKDIQSRYEQERWEFIRSVLSFDKAFVLDIGGNTGFFSFEALDAGASQVTYIEGNKEHAKFVQRAAEITCSDIIVRNEYFNFTVPYTKAGNYDIVFCLNVIHHLGDDFGDRSIDMANAKVQMASSFDAFSENVKTIVFQMGFCWKGSRELVLFKKGTKEELIQFVRNSIGTDWSIDCIGIAEMINGKTLYRAVNSKNILRDDELGEFRNRPIFILKRIEK